MLNIDSKKFQMTMEHCYNEDICFVEAEKTLYPYTHAQLGGCVLKKWNLPEIQVDAVTYHHELYSIDPDNHKLQCISAIVNLADLFCRKLGIGVRVPQENISLVDSEAACLLVLDDIRLAAMLDNFQENHAIETSYFF
jgi:HD-like signal output (HDOD) protein